MASELFHYDYKTTGTCSTAIHFDLEGDLVRNVSFDGGCNGNLKALGILVEGQTVDYVADKLSGNLCGPRNTSCADQLARAVKAAKEAKAQ